MKKRVLKILATIIFVLSLCSCQSSDTLKADYSIYKQTQREEIDVTKVDDIELIINNTKSYDELITTKIDIHEFSGKYGVNSVYYGNDHIKEIVAEIGIECLRYTDNGALYSIHKVKQGGLVYIFYHTYLYDQSQDFEDLYMNNWFYVNQKISSDDFKKIKKQKSTIEDVIKIDSSEQIWKNIFYSDIELFSLIGMVSRHYLQDGIYYIQYSYIDQKLVVEETYLEKTFDLDDTSLSIYRPYNARILDIDWLE